MVQLRFLVALHKKDLPILYSMKSYFGIGNVYCRKNDICVYTVQSITDLVIIINHFDKYPLITNKQADYKLFRAAYKLVDKREHLTIEGFYNILALKSSLNLGMSDKLKKAFPNIIPINRSVVLDNSIKDSNWLAGFVSAEGCFLVNIRSKPKMKIGYSVELSFVITQHSRDEQLMLSLIDYFNCGHLNKKNNNCFNLTVRKFTDINTKIIPFFSKYTIKGDKLLNFQYFCEAGKLINNKDHLTIEGLKKISEIKSKMNTSFASFASPSPTTNSKNT